MRGVSGPEGARRPARVLISRPRKKARLAPGFQVGRLQRESRWKPDWSGAAFGGPGAGAFARACDPMTGAVARRELARAAGALIAFRYCDGHCAVRADAAGDIEGGLPRIADRA